MTIDKLRASMGPIRKWKLLLFYLFIFYFSYNIHFRMSMVAVSFFFSISHPHDCFSRAWGCCGIKSPTSSEDNGLLPEALHLHSSLCCPPPNIPTPKSSSFTNPRSIVQQVGFSFTDMIKKIQTRIPISG